VLAGIYQLFFNKLGRTGTIANEAMGRYVLAGTVALYVGVALILIAWLHSTGRRLVWHRGDRAQAVAIGAGIGTGLGLLAIAVNSAIAGQLSTDPRAVFYVSEGDLPHILVTLALMAIAAPVVEEILFRGILMEWLRPKGAGAAFAATAVLFAVWHFNGKELRYYAVMGVILGALFWKRGLLASMTAHAVFNGSLATVAVVIALTPAQFMSFDGISFTKPQGWHAESAPASEQPLRVFAGPSGAAIAIAAPSLMGYPNVPDAVRLAQDIRSGDFRVSGAGIDASAPQLVNEPYGEIVELPFRESGMPGAVYYVPTMEGIVRVVTDAAGSARAQRGIDEFLSSLRFDPVP
jgi:membrane protease YdiL (CAAX protease family)